MPRLAKAVNVLAMRQVKQGTETARFRVGSMCLAWLKQHECFSYYKIIRQVKQGTETARFRVGSMCLAWLKQ